MLLVKCLQQIIIHSFVEYHGVLLFNFTYTSPRFDPWVEKKLWRWEWLCIPVLLPGESHGQRSLSMGLQRVEHYWATNTIATTLLQLNVSFLKAEFCLILTQHLLWSTYNTSCWEEKAFFFLPLVPYAFVLRTHFNLDKERNKLKMWMHIAKFMCIRSTKICRWKIDACDMTFKENNNIFHQETSFSKTTFLDIIKWTH